MIRHLACAAVLLSLGACNDPAGEPSTAPAPAAAAAEVTSAPAADAPAPAPAGDALPADVEAQRANAESCEHFAGEEPYDAERRREINKALADTCKPLRAALPGLKAKYAGDAKVSALLDQWDEIASAYSE